MTPYLSRTPLALQCNPATPASLALDLSVSVAWMPEGLQLTYTLTGDTAELRIPPIAQPGLADDLWQHTCFETFVATEGEASYREFNFSPSGQWAAYRFASERLRDTATDTGSPPQTTLSVTPHRLTLCALLPWNTLPPVNASLCIGLCAVIEEHDGRLSYWALQHPQARPDFHHPAGRSLRLAMPRT